MDQPKGCTYLDLTVQVVLHIAAFLLGLEDLELRVLLYVAALHVCFGLHLLKLVFEVGDHLSAVLRTRSRTVGSKPGLKFLEPATVCRPHFCHSTRGTKYIKINYWVVFSLIFKGKPDL